MKKQPQQPSMDEWLLDPIHGLEAGDENNVYQPITPSDFLTPEAFEYFSSIQPKRSAYNIERQIRRLISRSIWPRILVARCRLLLSTVMPLIVDGHWEFLEHVLTFVRTALLYLGFLIHGLRLFMNITQMIKVIISSDSVFTELQQHLTHSWFELFTDSHWIISALTPSDYLALSSTFMVLELGLIAMRAWIESRRLSHCIKAINDAIKKPDLQPDHLDELLRAKTHAEAMMQHTYKKLAINFGVTLLSACLFAFKNILLPFIAVSLATPLVPFIFAALAFSISIANHYLNQYVDQQKPKIPKTEQSTRHSFFYQEPTRGTFNENSSDLIRSVKMIY
ncbi:TPA: hypothetical protein JAN90_15215 [Legionella pneumophila]|nr:hypothetical protein [Legionella pneumophila]